MTSFPIRLHKTSTRPRFFGPGGTLSRPPVHSQSPLDPTVELSLAYQGNDRYVLILQADLPIHRLAVGIRDAPGGGPITPVSFGPSVAPNSTLLNVNPAAMAPIRDDTIYLEFLGNLEDPFLPLLDALNEPFSPTILMTFDNATNGLPPLITLEGVDEAFPGNVPVETALGDPVPLDEVGGTFYTNGADTDSDSVSTSGITAPSPITLLTL